MTKGHPRKEKPLRSITPITVAQTVYLTGMNYGRNSLVSHARACSFGFLFSFIPILTMVAVVLIRILHASPDTVAKIFAFAKEFGPYFDVQAVIDGLLTVKSVTIFEIIVGMFIFWITRGFFLSIFQGLQTIFHTKQRRQPIFTQVLTVIIEMVIVIVIAAIIFALIIMQTIVQIPILSSIANKLSPLLTFLSRYHINSLPNVLLFVVVTILYKIGAESKPS
ncbi:MAG: YihY/virulence factor BrkB family protein, partial [Treponema sp.]|nr:YihY/virulence factor BrkB family protein [Treponema sp.]